MNLEWLNDSKACLDVAKSLIKEIDDLTKQSLKDVQVLPYLKVRIKNCLENCRSPLDYAANYIFNTYCKKEYTEKELKKLKIYFPIRKNEHGFDICIRENFRKLKVKNPILIDALKKHQPFYRDHWLNHLTSLINENKHRNLTKQYKEQSTHIKSGRIGGVILENVTMVNVGTPIKIGDQNVDFINPSPYDHLFDATVKIEYFFDDLGLSVLPTLSKIYDGSMSVIRELEDIIEG